MEQEHRQRPPSRRGIKRPPSPFPAMRIGDDVVITTERNTTYTVVCGRRGFAFLSSNPDMKTGRLLTLHELGHPVVGERWEFALTGENSRGERGTSPVRQIIF
jgi:hypothetical protein